MQGAWRFTAAVASALLVAACSGGGDGAPPATTSSVVEMSSKTSSAAPTKSADGSTATAAGASTAVAASTSAGRLLASNCFGCHGTDGRSSGGFDSLAGKSASSIVEELRELRSRPEEGIMHVHALGYTDQQAWELASYFASQR